MEKEKEEIEVFYQIKQPWDFASGMLLRLKFVAVL